MVDVYEILVVVDIILVTSTLVVCGIVSSQNLRAWRIYRRSSRTNYRLEHFDMQGDSIQLSTLKQYVIIVDNEWILFFAMLITWRFLKIELISKISIRKIVYIYKLNDTQKITFYLYYFVYATIEIILKSQEIIPQIYLIRNVKYICVNCGTSK